MSFVVTVMLPAIATGLLICVACWAAEEHSRHHGPRRRTHCAATTTSTTEVTR